MSQVISHKLKEKSQFLLAFKGKNSRVPVWIMRQAGRYLPEYQAIKKNHALRDMFRNPDIASEITLQPIQRFNMDAAILFADILTMPSGMGFNIDFIDGKGPVIANPITSKNDVKRLGKYTGLDYVSMTIKKVNASLSINTPLIGFAGSPFTVLTYLCQKNNRFMMEEPKAFHQCMNILTINTINYLRQQQGAGIKAFQLFDTWAGTLRAQEYQTFVLPYVQQIFKNVNLPSIYYLKNCAHLMNDMQKSGADILSVCETVDIADIKTKKGIQGNLLNTLLYASDDILIKETKNLLQKAKKHHSKYIFNLNHGIMPDVNPQKVKLIVDVVHSFQWK